MKQFLKTINCKFCYFYLKVSLKSENNPYAVRARDLEKEDQPIKKNLSNLNGEGVKANLEPLNGIMSTFTHMLNPLIQKSLAYISTTVGLRSQQRQSRLFSSIGAGFSRSLLVSANEVRGFPPNW